MSKRAGTVSSTLVIAGVFGLAAMLAAGTTHAQTATATDAASADSLQEIVVTAERRVEDMQKTGASVSVQSGDDMLKQGRYSLQSILEDVPGIAGGAAFATGGTGGGGTDTPASGLIIRGIPSNIGAGGSITSTAPAAAIYVDGVYDGIGGGYDIDRVEALRGPQGTLYGRSATAGVVAIHTRNPDLAAIGGDALVEVGSYDLQHYTAALNLPIVDDELAVRVAGNRYQRNGFIDAAAGAVSSTDGKIKVLFKPNDAISLLLAAAAENNTDHSGGYLIGESPDPTRVKFDNIPTGQVTNKARQYWAEFNWNLGFGTLTYQPAYRNFGNDGTLYADGALGYLTNPDNTSKDYFVTHELRLSSNPDSKLTWQVGALYYDNDLASTNGTYIGPAAPPFLAFNDTVNDKKTTAYGAFAQATYPLADTYRVTGGLRYDKTTVAVTETFQDGAFLIPPPAPLPPPTVLSGDAGKRDFDNLTYKLRLEHDLTAANLLYASVSTGFSPGDVTVSSACPPFPPAQPCVAELKAETLTSYEIGSKNRFLDNTLQANATVFYEKYGAYQSAAINVNEGAGPPLFYPLTSPLESYGVESELLYKFTQADLLGFNLDWTKAHYVNKSALFAQLVAETDVSSNSAPGSVAPIPLTASLSYQHTFMLPGSSTLSLRGEALYSSSHGGDFNLPEQMAGVAPYLDIQSAVVGNVSATWTANKNLSVTGYVRNVADLQYFRKNTISVSPLGGYVYQQTYNDPRTFGVVLNVGF
jgi:iron complex outermembrane receptor protein